MRRAAYALVALMLTACGLLGPVDPGPDMTVDMTSEMVVGTWRSAGRNATFVFAADGTFEALNVPPEFFQEFRYALTPGFDADRDRIDAHGEWLLPAKDPAVPDRHRNLLELTWEPGGFIQNRGGGGLEAWWRGPQATLLFRHIAFVKCTGPCGVDSGLASASASPR